MRVLHTSDWHLGQRLVNLERTEEHQHFLNWLLQTIEEERVEVLLMAGDVFDNGAPSNTALKLYYDFLRRACATCCRHVIITGGNHDSVSTLNAPRELLQYFNIHVVGGASDNPLDELIELRDAQGQLQLVVCAVPFLRDRDVRLSVAGENYEQREQRIREGIAAHYAAFIPHLQQYKTAQVPVVATGHLFAAGGSASDSEKEIHIGNLGQIGADQFPAEFDYVALGHLHRPQQVNNRHHIRYSGSPIPLSFSEVADTKVNYILDFENGKLSALQELEIPCCRKLVRFKGSLEKVKQQLALFDNSTHTLTAWAEIQVELETPLPDLQQQLDEVLQLRPEIQVLIHRPPLIQATAQTLEQQVQEEVDLHTLREKDVFLKRCESAFPDSDHTELLATFSELLELMTQEET
ncbi:exonuclease SbcCD subunit D C-terminal domain-containing protein [Pontibacter sp. E15-1]|uniref:exonuclease SbcCD subunit D C-terminal domain-containing protein n=1 Tax=Pontibacter sp. E15-1 TaxID=2919918 RepID=UPI001F4FF354|nr:exonuclease SbcCD subunit D C-terminal domain-containing protein [Pontibacter sp. E15-1]MCJ8164539.1 exonuclease SbcCD subunit D C-terminal domain-containing protein [Pontibacter sp. E15-1]